MADLFRCREIETRGRYNLIFEGMAPLAPADTYVCMSLYRHNEPYEGEDPLCWDFRLSMQRLVDTFDVLLASFIGVIQFLRRKSSSMSSNIFDI